MLPFQLLWTRPQVLKTLVLLKMTLAWRLLSTTRTTQYRGHLTLWRSAQPLTPSGSLIAPLTVAWTRAPAVLRMVI